MPVLVCISPNKHFSPFCVDIYDRFGLARLWLGKRSACNERPFCTMSTASLKQHSDTVHWSSTSGCGCSSLEHSWQHCRDVSEWFMQKTEPLLKGAHFGQLRHSLKRNKKAVCVRGSPLTTCPIFINNIPLRLKVVPHSCYNALWHTKITCKVT